MAMPNPPDALLAFSEPGPDLLETQPEGTPIRIWIPHPYCEWVNEAEAESLLAQIDNRQKVRVQSPGFLPTLVVLDPSQPNPVPVVLTPAPVQGSVLVVANHGDLVEASGYSIPASKDGLVVFNTPEGPVEVLVRGGGREVILRGYVRNGHALWMRVDKPDEVRVLFDVGSSRLRPTATTSVRELADRAGGYQFTLQGSYSPEGDYNFNQRLAHARAVTVTNALIAAGVPEESIRSIPPPEEQVQGDDALQRSCLIAPVEAPPDGERPEEGPEPVETDPSSEPENPGDNP
jgi:outer membrane protein OmpA-like peptidoglycan-associated protein